MTRFHYFALILVLAAFVVTSSALLTRGQDWGDDFASYIMQAKSILNGTERQFIEQNSFAVSNSTVIFGPVAYAWGYPLILAVFYRVFGLNPLALSSSNIIFLLFFLVVFFLLMKNRLSPMEGILVIAVLAFLPKLIMSQYRIMSDIPFLAVSTLALLFIDRFVCNKGKPASILESIALGGAIFLASFIRPIGLSLLVTLLGCQIIVVYPYLRQPIERKKWLPQLITPYLVFGVLFGISAIMFPGTQEYNRSMLSYTASLFQWGVLKDHIWFYFHMIDNTFLSELKAPLIVYGFLLAFFLIGVMAKIGKDYLFVIFSILIISITVVYPLLGGARLLFPVFPFFIYFSFQGMKIGFKGISEHYQKVFLGVGYLFWIAVLFIFVTTSVKYALSNLTVNRQIDGPFDSISIEMFDFIKSTTPPDSVIVFNKPRAMRLMTDRNAIAINQCNLLNRGNIIVLHREQELSDQISAEKIATCNLALGKVFENKNFVVYQLDGK